MQYVRKNVWELGDDWADPVIWYARGVGEMKKKALDDPLGWRFYGAIHGLNDFLWRQYGYLTNKDTFPQQAIRDRFWLQCQHGSWYFLPWHRGYLIAFEAIIRDAVIKLGGPKDWALPYWNYFKQGQSALPPAFASADWPDGQGDNPLFVEQRWGPFNDGNVYVPLNLVNQDALTEQDFTGTARGGSTGFGGVDTGFEHGGPTHGMLETQPHDWVHGLVGGGKSNTEPGLMSNPNTAGLDPIFWLHHANIDRLWEVWLDMPGQNHANPTDTKWLQGPESIGERKFSMPMPDGTFWDYTPADMADLNTLDYSYDDTTPPSPQPPSLLTARLVSLGVTEAVDRIMAGGMVMATDDRVELIGANQAPLAVSGNDIRAAVRLDSGMRDNVTRSLAAAAETAAPDRVFLNLENVRGKDDATAFQVYVGVPEGENPADHPESLAGSLALFGVSDASDADGEHGGAGLNYVLEITRIVDRLYLGNALDVNALDVRIVPLRPVPEDAGISIGRISLYRQGK